MELPAFYELVRSYRAQMTRIKLASDYDLGVTFDAVRSDRAHLLFKLKYQPGKVKERDQKIITQIW